jgi:hypothetical protein
MNQEGNTCNKKNRWPAMKGSSNGGVKTENAWICLMQNSGEANTPDLDLRKSKETPQKQPCAPEQTANHHKPTL